MQRLADRISSVFVPVVLAVAGLTLLVWVVSGNPFDDGFTAAVTVLVIACPCALGLATPTALLVDESGQYRSETPPYALAQAVTNARNAGHTAVLVEFDDRPAAVFAVGDTVKPSSNEAVRRLGGLGLSTYPLTGDHRTSAAHVAAEVGIDNVVAEVIPADKASTVRNLQEQGRTVAMVGDGVDDAAALVQDD